MIEKVYLVDNIPGSISNIYEIKILICRILSEIKVPITRMHLVNVFQINQTMNYFNFCQAMVELERSKHVLEKEDENKNSYLYLTRIGEEVSKALEKNISIAALEKSIKGIKKLIKEEHENKDKIIDIKTKKDGFIAKLVLQDIESNLLDLELFCPTEEIAKNVKEQMRKKTTEIYKAILATIDEDSKALIEIANSFKDKPKKLKP